MSKNSWKSSKTCLRTFIVLEHENFIRNDEVMKYLSRQVESWNKSSRTSELERNTKISLKSLERFFKDLVFVNHLHLNNNRVFHIMDPSTRNSANPIVPDMNLNTAIPLLEALWVSSFWEINAVQCDQAFNNTIFKNYWK